MTLDTLGALDLQSEGLASLVCRLKDNGLISRIYELQRRGVGVFGETPDLSTAGNRGDSTDFVAIVGGAA